MAEGLRSLTNLGSLDLRLPPLSAHSTYSTGSVPAAVNIQLIEVASDACFVFKLRATHQLHAVCWIPYIVKIQPHTTHTHRHTGTHHIATHRTQLDGTF